ncbi:hypothetical protein [Clostridium sp. BNL1100]|uniref:hypothetical protein n=1 Tax=Clostridium sp. BNL1100 TaxID=755731 RepID=UPI00024A7C99|nr:hypothetical protein [Clostridium sp. BNL1100]AEY65752.1 hypothetical protein Clo1100_1524 [Clostridium sp. BNL1100]
MKNKFLTHNDALDLVYNVIAALRKEGRTKIKVSEIARTAGVSRSTINSNHKDWAEVRDVIRNNKPSVRVNLALDEIRERTKWQIEASRLDKELLSCHEDLKELTEFVENVYKKLLNQLHKYVYQAKKVPGEMEREAKVLLELQELKKRVEYYEAEIRNLKADSVNNAAVLPFIKKEIVEVFTQDQRADLLNKDLLGLSFDALSKLDYYFTKHNYPKVVYVLCGNFASGKSTWISEHRPSHEGTTIYFESTNHSKDLRTITLKYISKLSSDCKVICVRTMCDVEQCLVRNSNDTRLRFKNVISEELIKVIEKNFEEVSVKEGFDEIIIVGGT